jgi:glycosyltransferase involved in cell wall biosynthesis
VKKIAYIEIDTHAEIAQAFMDIMKGSQDFSVDYYFSKRIKDHVIHEDEAVFLSDSSMILDQLKGKGYDLVIIGTVHRYFNTFLAVTKKYSTAVIAHNLNFIKASKLDLMKSVFKGDIIFRLKLWLKEGLFYKTRVYHTSRALFVLDEALISEKYQFLPLFYTRDFAKTQNDDFVVVIPGGVSQKRRDYAYIFKTIQRLSTNKRCRFVFLGKAGGSELKQLKSLSEKIPENIKITYFSERVSSEDFEQWMRKADVLWCPIQQSTEFFSMEEIYGRTKMTGNLGDAIAYGKMAVFPGNYPSRLAFIIPEKENAFEQLETISDTPFDFHKTYGRRDVQKKLEQFLRGLL